MDLLLTPILVSATILSNMLRQHVEKLTVSRTKLELINKDVLSIIYSVTMLKIYVGAFEKFNLTNEKKSWNDDIFSRHFFQQYGLVEFIFS